MTQGTNQSSQPASQPYWTHAIMHKPISFIRGVGVGLAAAKLQHIQLLHCLNMSQSQVLYSHLILSISSVSESQILQSTKAPLKRACTYPSKGLYITPQQGLYTPLKRPLYTPQKGLCKPLKRASTIPSKGPLYTFQKDLYILLKKVCNYTSKGLLYTPQKGLYNPNRASTNPSEGPLHTPSKGPLHTCSLLFKAGDALPQSHALLALHLVRPLLQKGSCPACRMACYQGFQSSPLHRW